MGKIKDIIKDITKKYWEGSVLMFWDMKKIDVNRISTGLLSLDLALWGWLPEWRSIEIYWPNSSGKTTLSIKFLAEVQKKYPEKKVAFIDVEHAIDLEYAKKLGLNLESLLISQPNSAEQALGIMEALAGSWEVKAIVLDSVAKLTPRKELEWDIGDAEMWGRARLMGQWLRKIAPKASTNECTCFFINQIRQSIGVTYWNPEVRPWWNALPYEASVIIDIRFKKIDELSGQSTMRIRKNKVGIPFKHTTIWIKYGMWFDFLWDLVTTAIDLKIINQGWAWFNYWEQKWQGKDKIVEEIKDNDEFKEEILEKIKESFNI